MFEFILTEDALEKSPEIRVIEGCGAMTEFLGIVRSQEEGSRLSALNYEAYREMAQKEGDDILRQICQEHGLLTMQVWHRLGKVAVGEISLRVRVYSAHRKAAFDASSQFIERLKKDVPIWKNPVWA